MKFKNIVVPESFTMFHATPNDFSTFKLGNTGKVSTIFGSENVKRYGIFFTPNKEFAKEFVKSGYLLTCRLERIKVLDLREGFPENVVETISRGTHSIEKYLYNIDNTWELFDGDNGDWFRKEVLSLGFDAVRFMEPDKTHKMQDVICLLINDNVKILDREII